MAKASITIEFDPDHLSGSSDEHLALLWHVAQHNPADITDQRAGDLVEAIGREIIRRWLRAVEPPLWHHQGRHYSQMQLSAIAKYEPGGPAGSPEFGNGRWVPKQVEQS
jgi:hypothetical protein